MNTQQIKDWIKDNLSGKRYNLVPNKAADINAIWGQQKASDGKYYDACITYFINNKEHARFVATDSNLADSIDFSYAKKTCDHNKLHQLLNDIEQSLNKGGDYKLVLLSNTNFAITTL